MDEQATKEGRSGSVDPGPGDHRGVTSDLSALRELVARAKGMPMSASCIVNRSEALELVDRIAAALPRELSEARGLLDDSTSQIAQAESRANRIIEDAREQAVELASHTSVVQQAQEIATRLKHEAEAEAAELRIETDSFVDERMAGFESVLQKTTSQVRTARARLSERSRLDDGE